MYQKLFFLAASTIVIAACASAPSISLQPADVPSLYGEYSPNAPLAATELAEVPVAVEQVPTAVERVPTAVERVPTAAEQTPIATAAAGESVIGQQQQALARAGQLHASEGELSQEGQCLAIREELAKLDSGLGGPAEDSAPAQPPTTAQKTGKALYDIGVGTLLGPLQIFIQTKRAIFGDAEKERLRDEALERGTTRRAYLLGYAKARGCNAVAADATGGKASMPGA